MQGAAHFGRPVSGLVVGTDATLAQNFSGVFKGSDTGHAAVERGQVFKAWRYSGSGSQIGSPV